MGDTRDRVGNAGVIVAGGAFKIALYVCIVVLIIWLGRLSYQSGHDIFDQQPMSPGEGQEITVVVKEDDSVYDIAKTLESKGLVALRYVDNFGKVTETYPANPNGSPNGITAVTTESGRVTIMMPHPERVFRTVSNSWHPENWGEDGPWMRIFRNARKQLG